VSPDDGRQALSPESEQALDDLKLAVARDLGVTNSGRQQQYEQILDSWKYEVADELGLAQKVNSVGWGNMTSRECGKVGGRMGGKIGGNMVKRMIEFAERNMR
jgi:hypothetical protein